MKNILLLIVILLSGIAGSTQVLPNGIPVLCGAPPWGDFQNQQVTYQNYCLQIENLFRLKQVSADPTPLSRLEELWNYNKDRNLASNLASRGIGVENDYEEI